MSARLRRLAERLRAEVPELDREAQRALRSWKAAQTEADIDAYIDSVALNLHGLYTGIERLLSQIAEQLDGRLVDGETWHRALLQQMATPIPEVRPAVLRSETSAGLDELRKFRHIVRNVYTARLTPDRMQPLVETLPELWAAVRADLMECASFIEQLSLDETETGA